MLHEVILSLQGCLSSILHKNSYDVELAKVLHPSEQALLKRILQIGETYGNIKSFIDQNIFPSFDCEPLDAGIEEYTDNGMYFQAFCDGLQNVLEPYRNEVVMIEKIALKDPSVSLTLIITHIGGYSLLLYTLESMINEIKENHIHGCKILEYVCRHLCTGVESMREALSEIATCCHSVLISQLSNWLLYGQLMDQYNEFFIRLETPNQKSSNEIIESCKNVGKTESGKLSFVDSSTSIYQNTVINSLTKEKVDYDFRLEEDFLPPYISHITANKILYIGRTVVLFKTDLQKGKAVVACQRDIFNQEELNLIKSLQNCSFLDSQKLDSVIVDLESSVTQKLWTLAMEQADLMGQLRAIKDFYLLGRGEMFVDFLNKIGPAFNKQISQNVTRDLNVALVASARNIQYPYENSLEKFSFSLPPKESFPGDQVKAVFRLEYTATLPLHLFFSPVVIDNYNILFKFFLRVKQIQLNLHTIWLENVKDKKQLLTDRAWQLRNQLMFLVDNLQCYLQWDVVENEHTALLNELSKTQDFEKIRHLHHRFLYNVLSQSFLIPNDAIFDQNTGLLVVSTSPNQNAKPHNANVFLRHILDISEGFCRLVAISKDSEKKKEKINLSDELETMAAKLCYSVQVLLKLIKSLRNQLSGVHLTKLLLRLDFNHYFSRNYGETPLVAKN